MKESTVLIISAGQTDVKALVKQDGRFYKAEINKIRQFYERISKNNFAEVKLISESELGQCGNDISQQEQQGQSSGTSLPLLKNDGGRPVWVDLFPIQRQDNNGGHRKNPSEGKPEPVTLPSGNQYILVPAKLDSVIQSLSSCRGGLVFATRRNECSYTKSEPTYVAELLCKWLNEHYKKEEIFTPVLYLQHDEKTEAFAPNSEIQQNVPVLREAAVRIDDAIKSLRNKHPQATAVLSLGGGMPDFNSIIEASALLHFGPDRVIYKKEKETGSQETIQIEERKKRVSVIDSLRIRSQCIRAIEYGDFVGAYTIAEAYDKPRLNDANAAVFDRDVRGDPLIVENWVADVRNYARFFAGYPVEDVLSETIKNSLLHKLCTQKDYPVCLLAALEVEAYLRGHKYREALAATYRFIENVKLDGLHRIIPDYDPYKNWIKDLPSNGLKKLFKRNSAFIINDGNKLLLQKIELDLPLSHKLLTAIDNEKSLKDMRNKLTHSRMSEQEVKDLIQTAAENIWQFLDSRLSLLACPTVKEVLDELDGSNSSPCKWSLNNWVDVFDTLRDDLKKSLIEYSVAEIQK